MNGSLFKCFVLVFVVGLFMSSAAFAQTSPSALARSVDERADAALVTASATAAEVRKCKSELEAARELAGKALASGRSNRAYLNKLDERVENLEKKFDEAMRKLVDSCAAFGAETATACIDLKKGEHATNDKAIGALWTGGGSVKKEVITEVTGTETRTEREYFDSVVRSGSRGCVRKEMLRGADKSSGAGGLILRTEEGCDEGSTAQQREVERLDEEASARGWVTGGVCALVIGGLGGAGWAVGKSIRPGKEKSDGSKEQSGGVLGLAIGGGAGGLICSGIVLARHGNGDEETASSGYSVTPTVGSDGGGFAFSGSF